MIQKFLLSILVLSMASVYTPLRMIGGKTLPVDLTNSPTVLEVLQRLGEWGKIVKTAAQVDDAQTLPPWQPLELGEDYTFVKETYNDPVEFVKHLIEKGGIIIEPIYRVTHKITCNGLSFTIDHYGNTSFEQTFLVVDLYQGKAAKSFMRRQSFRDILLMIFFAANRKDEMPDSETHEEDFMQTICELGDVLDTAKGHPYFIPHVSTLPIEIQTDFYAKFIGFASLSKMITPEQADRGVKFLGIIQQAFTVHDSCPANSEQHIFDLLKSMVGLDEPDADLIKRFVSLDFAPKVKK